MRWRDIRLEDFGNDVVLALEEVELAGERGLDGGEVRINVGPGKSEGGGRGGVGLEVFEGFAKFFLLLVDECEP